MAEAISYGRIIELSNIFKGGWSVFTHENSGHVVHGDPADIIPILPLYKSRNHPPFKKFREEMGERISRGNDENGMDLPFPIYRFAGEALLRQQFAETNVSDNIVQSAIDRDRAGPGNKAVHRLKVLTQG